VKAHHERWDGKGYPVGLKGDAIPIGARILTAVDYLDALASDRQYRRGLPASEVLEKLSEQSGKALDPTVVGILRRRFAELEGIARQNLGAKTKALPESPEEPAREHQPATGLAWEKPGERSEEVLDMILAARQEAQALFELSRDLGASLSLSETLSVLGVKLKSLIPYDAIAVFVTRGDKLTAEYVSGEDFRLLAALQIPVGEGVCGWVAQNGKMILNGNPTVEPGHPQDAMKTSQLKAALAVPLQGLQGVIGVLALYRLQPGSFSSDELRVLLAVSSKTGLALENALKFQQAESSATMDYVTGLPNARAMFLQLDRELARCERESGQLTVIVCDLVGLKKVNDQFGHQEGNRVLKLFADKMQAAVRKYDHVARLGGDEFVIMAPDLPPDVANAKIAQLREIAHQVSVDICGEELVELSVGQAAYPEDGGDAETVLEKADRRMYEAKQAGARRADKRQARRVKCCVPVEVLDEAGTPVVGTLVNLSRGGCYVETTALLGTGTQVKLSVWQDGGNVQLAGTVVRSRPGSGLAVEFSIPSREIRENINKFLQSIQLRAQEYGPEQRYLATTRAN
jgi:diguanylate cyclase (GGDEF)-like protein